MEHVVAWLTSPTTTLRLLPVSGGIFSGPHKPFMPAITMRALSCAPCLLSPEEARVLEATLRGGSKLDLCIFEADEFAAYRAALAEARGEAPIT